jgi:hypothetical protein
MDAAGVVRGLKRTGPDCLQAQRPLDEAPRLVS